ncbi:MAG: MFS transporter [Pseudomonas sp.]|uniref:MFS transporter n=1 Tax=Pseudomonas sp. TaxID=306 RepID=UPI003398389A
MLLRNPYIVLLAAAQALYWCCSLIGITLTALVGLQLAPSNALATLPLALLVLGGLLTVQPLSALMQRHGRRPGLLLGAGAGVLGGLLSALGVWLGDFGLFCLGALPIGSYQASAMYYRFAAMDAVSVAQRGRAAAYVMGGGVLAALLAPSLALVSRNALATPFVGAYALIALLALCGAALLNCLPAQAASSVASGPRIALASLLARPTVRLALLTTAVGHGLMMLVMNATPLAMSLCGLSIEAGAQVIQWHLLGMFLPAFIAGPLVDRLGSRRIALLGSLVLALSAAVAMTGLGQAQFLLSSFLLGLGWNLMMIAGTTLLAAGHSAEERGQAQGLMELGNGSVAALGSFASGVLITGLGWNAVNIGMLPLLLLVVLLMAGVAQSRVSQPN